MDSMPVNLSACFQPVSKLSILNIVPSVLNDDALKKKAAADACHCTDPIERLRLQCFSLGIASFKRLARHFESLGKDQLSFEELFDGLRNFGLNIDEQEARRAYEKIANGHQSISFQEFFDKLKPPLNQIRRSLLEKVFTKIYNNGTGAVTVDAMHAVFDHRKDAQFLSGAKTKEDVFKMFLDSFDIDSHSDGKVSRDDFFNFYAAKSAAVEGDIYFDHMIRNTWLI